MKKICYESFIILDPDEVSTQDSLNEVSMLLGEQITKLAKVTNMCIADLGRKPLVRLFRGHNEAPYIDLFCWAEEQQYIIPIIENILDDSPSVFNYIIIKHEDITTLEDVEKHLCHQSHFKWIKRPEQLNKPEPIIDAWDVIFGRATYPEK